MAIMLGTQGEAHHLCSITVPPNSFLRKIFATFFSFMCLKLEGACAQLTNRKNTCYACIEETQALTLLSLLFFYINQKCLYTEFWLMFKSLSTPNIYSKTNVASTLWLKGEQKGNHTAIVSLFKRYSLVTKLQGDKCIYRTSLFSVSLSLHKKIIFKRHI